MQDFLNPSIFPWQWAILPAFVIGWILGGAFLLKRSFFKVQPQSKAKFGKFLLTSLLSGTGGLAMGGAVYFLVDAIGKQLDADVRIVSAAIALVIALLAAYIIVYAMLNLPAKQSFKVGTPALLAVGLLGLAAGLGCVLPAMSARQDSHRLDVCHKNLLALGEAIRSYEDRNGKPPATLQDIVDDPHKEPSVKATIVLCAPDHGNARQYFYRPARGLPPALVDNGQRHETQTKTLRLCDFKGNHPNGRYVQFINGYSQFVLESDFQELLKLSDNFDFAKELKAVEK